MSCMSKKRKYIPVPDRISILADLVNLNNLDTDNPIDIARFNALEEALAIMEDREPIVKEIPIRRRNIILATINRIKERLFNGKQDTRGIIN